MDSITQELKYKQSIVKYALRNGVKAALENKSKRPHTSPNAYTESEIKLIRNYKRKNKDTGLGVLWVKLMQAGYKRSITSLYRMIVKLGIYNKVRQRRKNMSQNCINQ